MGIAVFAGMIGVTAFGIFLTPVFYVLLRKLAGNRPLTQHGDVPHVAAFAAPRPAARRSRPWPRRRGPRRVRLRRDERRHNDMTNCHEHDPTTNPDGGARRTRCRGRCRVRHAGDRTASRAAAAGGLQGARRPLDRPPHRPKRSRAARGGRASTIRVLDELVARADVNSTSIAGRGGAAGAGARAAARDRCRPPAAARRSAPARSRGSGSRRRASRCPGPCSAPALSCQLRARPVRPAREASATPPRSMRSRARRCCRARGCWSSRTSRRPISRCVRWTTNARWCADRRRLPRHAAPDRAAATARATSPSSISCACGPRSRRPSPQALALDRRRAEPSMRSRCCSARCRRSSRCAKPTGPARCRSCRPACRAACWRAGPTSPAAQRAMLAAQSRVGVAQAAWFPTSSLTAAGGYASAELGDLFKWSARAWGVGALLSLPLFDGGRRAGRRRRRERAVGRRRRRAIASRCWTRSARSKTSSRRCACSQQQAECAGRARSPPRRAPPCCPIRATATARSASSSCSMRGAASSQPAPGAAGARRAVPGDGRA